MSVEGRAFHSQFVALCCLRTQKIRCEVGSEVDRGGFESIAHVRKYHGLILAFDPRAVTDTGGFARPDHGLARIARGELGRRKDEIGRFLVFVGLIETEAANYIPAAAELPINLRVLSSEQPMIIHGADLRYRY